MTSAATRSYVRHAGDHSPEWLAERDRKEAEHRAELEARQAAFRAENPELAARMDRRRR